MKVEMGKKYRTKCGEPVELLSVTGRGDYPVIGYIGTDCRLYRWTSIGCYVDFCGSFEERYNLVEVREPREWTIRVDANGSIYPDTVLLSTWTSPFKGPIEMVHVREVLEDEK